MIKITQNPLFRICGVVAVIYYGLFQSKSDNGLNKRLSPDKIKSNISDISQKSIYIIDNIQQAKADSLRKHHDTNNDSHNKIEEVKSEQK